MDIGSRIIQLRERRMHFDQRVDREIYQELFRLMSPVMTSYWTMPGNPPTIQHRADFSDFQFNDLLRGRREIVKGRFQNGGIAYVYFDELELFAALYRKPLKRLLPKDHEILSLIEHEGPINVKGIKEVLSMYVKDITPVLHRLQTAFIVFEDQRSIEWDRGWYAFEREFPELDLNRYTFEQALRNVLIRFQHLMVWFEVKQAENFYKIPAKAILKVLESLVSDHVFAIYEINGKTGYLSRADLELLDKETFGQPTDHFFCLNRNDLYVKAMEAELKVRFPKNESEPMYYLLHQGIFKGAVYGHFKIGPNILDDVRFDTNVESMRAKKTEVIKAIGKVENLDRSPIRNYMGEINHG